VGVAVAQGAEGLRRGFSIQAVEANGIFETCIFKVQRHFCFELQRQIETCKEESGGEDGFRDVHAEDTSGQ
jgi:hypothetical protein